MFAIPNQSEVDGESSTESSSPKVIMDGVSEETFDSLRQLESSDMLFESVSFCVHSIAH